MSDEHVIRYCAPTLASIKTGSLFTCPFAERGAMLAAMRAFNRRLSGRGLRMLPLRYRDGVALVYLYRPGLLERDLMDGEACALLRGCGYPCGDAHGCVRRLIERLALEEEGFPHEIGLFLSYPPGDVRGFMQGRTDAKCCGIWKVFGDEEGARRTFAKYRKCHDVYMRKWSEGRSIERMTVAG